MGPEEKKAIWFPSVVFENTKQKVKAIVDEESLIAVERHGSGEAADDTFTENKLLYSGNENPLHYEQLANLKFVCILLEVW